MLKKTVVLVGMMGSGKSAVGMTLARLLNAPFLDSDDEIVTASNLSIAEIFERDGEPFFREKESQVIERLLKGNCGILSTGGGSYLTANNRAMISEIGIAVWLRADLKILWSRVRNKNTRPLLQTDDPRATLGALNDQREAAYAKADLVVEANAHYTVADMADRVIEALLSRPDVLVKGDI